MIQIKINLNLKIYYIYMNSDGKFSIGNFDLIDLFNLIYLNNFLQAFYPQFLYEDSNFPQNIIMKNNSSNVSLDLNNNDKEKILSANQKGIKSEIDLSASFNNQQMQKTTYHQSLNTNFKGYFLFNNFLKNIKTN